MANANITFRTDEEIKKVAGEVFTELGMDMTTGLNIYLRMVAREKRIPFEVVINEPDAEYRAWMTQKLAESKERAKDPNTKWYSPDEIKTKYGLEK